MESARSKVEMQEVCVALKEQGEDSKRSGEKDGEQEVAQSLSHLELGMTDGVELKQAG